MCVAQMGNIDTTAAEYEIAGEPGDTKTQSGDSQNFVSLFKEINELEYQKYICVTYVCSL